MPKSSIRGIFVLFCVAMFFHPFFDFDGSGYGPQAGSYYQRGEDVNNSRLYEVLGVPRNATDAQIRKAYLVKAKQMHPDKGGNPVEVVFSLSIEP